MFGLSSKDEKKLKFTNDDAKLIVSKSLSQLQSILNDKIYINSSDDGIITAKHVDAVIKNALSSSSTDGTQNEGRVTVSQLASKLGLDKITTNKHLQAIASDLGSDVYYLNETYLTK